MGKLFLVLLISIVLISGCVNQSSEPNPEELKHPDTEETEEICLAAGAGWGGFPDTCRDHCNKARYPNHVGCAEIITMGCDCGPDMCWNGYSCEEI